MAGPQFFLTPACSALLRCPPSKSRLSRRRQREGGLMGGSPKADIERLRQRRDIQSLIQALLAPSPDPETLFAAAEALGEIGDDAAVDSLIPYLGDYLVPAESVLARIGTPRALDALMSCLEGPPSSIGDQSRSTQAAAQAGMALAEFVPAGSIDRLREVVIDESAAEHVRIRAFGVLARMDRPEAKDILLAILAHPRIGPLALRGMEGAKLDRDFLNPLRRWLTHADWEVRGPAVSALGSINVGEVVDVLIDALEDEVYDVRRRAVVALCSIKDERAIEPLKRAASRETDMKEWVLMCLRDAFGVEGGTASGRSRKSWWRRS